ncbi:hypothetical protein J2X55_000426 [Microbacterium sp. 1154]|nr:hypothetical protein [Microbacterium sp. 1154]MDR6689527.1 hypothetical protein [Microbacterium sp. 1154]
MIVSNNLRTAPLGLTFFQGQHVTEYSLLAAAGVKRFVSGMVGGISQR